MTEQTHEIIELVCYVAVIWAVAVWILASVSPIPLW
jgi:hypothetical protein